MTPALSTMDATTADEIARRTVESDPVFMCRLAETWHRDRETALKFADEYSASRGDIRLPEQAGERR